MSRYIKNFKKLFNPKSVAFIGASSNMSKWGFRILLNLLNGGYKGTIYPINPHEKEILGLQVYQNLSSLPNPADMMVIVVPPESVPSIVGEAANIGIHAGVVITAGFAELGGEGERLQQEFAGIARSVNMVLVGPNCNGINSPDSCLYCTMPPIFPKPGRLSIVSQSGNVGASILRRAVAYDLGVANYAASGNEAVLQCQDYLEYYAQDPQTAVVAAYIEGLRDGSGFFEVAKNVTINKPVIAIKVGHTEAGARAAKSHTGALSGSDRSFNALCKQSGIIRVDNIDELFFAVSAFSTQPLPKGNRVGIITQGGGWGVLAADACSRAGLNVIRLPDEVIKKLDSFLPAWWSRNNPVDLVAGLKANQLKNSVEILLDCPQIDAVVVLVGIERLWRMGNPIFGFYKEPGKDYAPYYKETAKITSQAGLNETTIKLLREASQAYQKPVLMAAEMPHVRESGVYASSSKGQSEDLFYFPSPHQAAFALSCLYQYSKYRNGEKY